MQLLKTSMNSFLILYITLTINESDLFVVFDSMIRFEMIIFVINIKINEFDKIRFNY